MAKRTYNQYCGLARALDLIGERWTLLIVRDLSFGPRRFKDLLDGLPGIGNNLLAARLKALETDGVVKRQRTSPSERGLYELTERGKELVPALLPLARWGAQSLARPKPGELMRPIWFVMALTATLRHNSAKGVRETYELRLEDEPFHIRVEDGIAKARQGPASSPDLVISSDLGSFLAVSSGRLAPEAAIAGGKVKALGSSGAVRRFFEIFAPRSGTRS